MSNPRVAILASGEGTTAETVIRSWANNAEAPRVELIISNNRSAGVFKRAKSLNKELDLSINCKYISKITHPAKPNEHVMPGGQTASEEEAILKLLQKGNFDLIVLMGYMKRVGPKLVHKFGWRPDYKSIYESIMLNTHPGLLPDTKKLYGMLVAEHVLAKRLPCSGQTLHVVADEYDEGPTVAEHKIYVLPEDTPQSLFQRVQVVEKQYIADDLLSFIKSRQKYLEKKES